MPAKKIPALIIAGTHSGAGKTTITLGIMAALKKQGYNVQPFKIGPDYIDPGYHQFICHNPSINLDDFMLRPEYIKNSFTTYLHKKDIGIIEGVMGLFDGKFDQEVKGIRGSTARIAKILNLPVVLVIDCKGMGQSVGAIIEGFKNFDPEISLAGVIFNRVGSRKHFELLKQVAEEHCQVKVIGYFPVDEKFSLQERYLGLITISEKRLSPEFLKSLTEQTEATINLELLQTLGAKTHSSSPPRIARKKKVQKIGVARDAAFSFYYQENLDLLKNSGAELVFFSPLSDKKLPPLEALYFGGGYPELHAKTLEKNISLKREIKEFAEQGGRIYAECGGFMYLTEGIIDLTGNSCQMVGIFPTQAIMLAKKKALGYREIILKKNCLLGKEGTIFRGHEYHYSEILPMPAHIPRIYSVDNESAEGYLYKNTLGSYIHLHFGSNYKTETTHLLFDHHSPRRAYRRRR